MQVLDQIDLGNGHLIEYGRSSRDNGADISIRDRWPRADGGFRVFARLPLDGHPLTTPGFGE